LESHENMNKKLARLLSTLEDGKSAEKALNDVGFAWSGKTLWLACLAGKGQTAPRAFATDHFQKSSGDTLAIIGSKEVFFLCSADKVSNVPPTYISELIHWLEAGHSQLALSLSSPLSDVGSLARELSLVRNTAAAAIAMGHAGLLKCSKWLLPSLLLDKLRSAEAAEVYRSILRPLYEYDANYNGELIDTLRIFAHASKNELAAQELNIHVNTLRYRLQKIEDMTGLSPQKPDEMRLLAVAVMLGDLGLKDES
jgi:DNA-binding PucR family transcriptional regulator